MVGLHHHHEAKHARQHAEAGELAPGSQPHGLPEEFLPLRERAEKVARGEWVDPALEDYYRALRRKHAAWEREQRGA